MRIRNMVFLLAALFAYAWPGAAAAQSAGIDPAMAAQYFEDAKLLSDADGGRLWGVKLYGPMFFVDPATNEVAANQADAQGKLTRHGGVWTGKLPAEFGAANTAIEWAGVHWTMVMWPLPDDRRERDRLLMHECFHRIQAKLGLPAQDAVNNQLDTREGRIWLQLEWRALERALIDFYDPGRRESALRDALLFRAWRRSLFPGSTKNEDALEMNEGLAEYTGQRLANPTRDEMRAAAMINLHEAHGRRTFARSFAYLSGPAYGALLDGAPLSAKVLQWRKELTPETDFGALVARAYLFTPAKPTEAAVNARLAEYDGDVLIARETERDKRQQAVLAEARRRFEDAPVLIFPAVMGLNYSFDPNNVISLDDSLTLYTPLKVSDDWGVLECEKGAVLVRQNGKIVRAQVPAPADPAARPVKLDGCTLDLHAGWTLAPGVRAGDYVLKPTP